MGLSKPTFKVVRRTDGQLQATIQGRNGKQVWLTGDGYTDEHNAETAIAWLIHNIQTGNYEILDEVEEPSAPAGSGG